MNRLTLLEPVTSPLECPVITDPRAIVDQYAAFHHDESKLVGGPILSISFPRNAEEVSFILNNNFRQGIPTTISGARTGITGGASPGELVHLLSLQKIRGFTPVEYDALVERPYIGVSAGMTLAELNQYLHQATDSWFFPVDPTETSATLAGMTATNASGARSYCYGPMRDWVRWIRVVLADGSILELRRGAHRAIQGTLLMEMPGEEPRELVAAEITKPQTKNVLGYMYSDAVDPIDLFIGSEGTLGVITDVEVYLAPLPKHRLYFLQFFPSEEGALDFVEALREQQHPKSLAIEFCDKMSLDILRESPAKESCRAIAMIEDSYAATVYCEFPYETEDALAEVYEKLSELVSAAGADIERSIAGTEDKDLRDLKMFRHAIPESINARIAKRKVEIPALHKVATDMAVPNQYLRQIFALYREKLTAANLEYAIFGHAGNNHFHVNIMPRTLAELSLAKEVYKEFALAVVAMGGAVSAEHGLGRIKKDFLTLQYSPEVMAEMQKIKRFFDTRGLLNPGVLV